MTFQHRPGDIVRARDREWVIADVDGLSVSLRPLAGSEEDVQVLSLAVEGPDAIQSAEFWRPSPQDLGNREQALLLKDAMSLSIRRGAGPFRSAASITFTPRSYQIAPLLMALKLDPVRLLIADDVGIGKTIEAGLILREMLDRAAIRRFAVVCPAHLVTQWVEELKSKFEIDAVAVTTSTAARLERGLPETESLFRHHPFTVVSLDFIKGAKRIDDFIRSAPEMVVIDEAHTCVTGNESRHRRFEVASRIAAAPDRHLLLLTATPHSGIENAFLRLLGLIDRAFVKLGETQGDERRDLREKLGDHFIQRRRLDLKAFPDGDAFPQHLKVPDAKFRLGKEHGKFIEDVLDYCHAVVTKAGEDERKQRLAFWGTLALMRCVSSSPAAAVSALSARARAEAQDEDPDFDNVLDRDDDDVEGSDVEPDALARIEIEPMLEGLINQAKALQDAPGKDPKLACLKRVVSELRAFGHNPVVFCRYISTARLVGDYLAKAFKDAEISVVTGELPPSERREAVTDLMAHPSRILVATDCLSEGINLQDGFDAIVHYDLSWNPTKHQQREGRVDRFQQPSKIVRSVMIYGEDSPVDGAVLNVIFRGAEAIQKQLGVIVSLPEDERAVSRALMQATLLRAKGGAKSQMTFDFFAGAEEAMELHWRDAAEREKRTKTIFAQSRLKPQDIVDEWKRANDVLGTSADVLQFTRSALNSFGISLATDAPKASISLEPLPAAIRERLDVLGLKDELTIHTDDVRAPSRSHPLVATLAEHIVESALEGTGDRKLARAAVWRARDITEIQTIVLARLRFRIFFTTRSGETMRVAEQVGAFRLSGRDGAALVSENALALLKAPAAQDVPDAVAERMIGEALLRLEAAAARIERYADDLGKTLEDDHRRVARAGSGRDAQIDIGRARVEAIRPVDVIGLFVVLPALQG
jgi:superfamily II DNA or RNA helicase